MNKRVLVRDLPASFGRAMFRLAAVCMLAFWCFAGARAATPAQGWRIDEEHTWIGFKIDAVGFSPTRGHFTRYSGRILIDFDRPAKSFTTFTVETASVDVGSRPFDDFVKSAALLNAEKFPIVSFTSTQVEKLDARTARVTGPLTMLGVSKPITLTVSVETDTAAKGRAVAFVATGKITRSEFGMMFGGTIANIGVHGQKVALHLECLWDRNISITTRLVDTVTIPMLFNTVRSHKIDPKRLITHRFKLDRILDAYDTFGNAAKTKALKVIIEA